MSNWGLRQVLLLQEDPKGTRTHSHRRTTLRLVSTPCTKLILLLYNSLITTYNKWLMGEYSKTCHSTFAQYSSMQKHQRVHDKKKPYKCKYEGCAQAFTQVPASNRVKSSSVDKQSDKAREDPHGGETLRMQPLPQEVRFGLQPEATHAQTCQWGMPHLYPILSRSSRFSSGAT